MGEEDLENCSPTSLSSNSTVCPNFPLSEKLEEKGGGGGGSFPEVKN